MIRWNAILMLALGTMPTVVVSEFQQQPTMPARRVSVIVNQPGPIGQALGFPHDALDEIACKAARSQGWVIDHDSQNVIVVSITPQTQTKEDLYDFSIEVVGSSPALGNARNRPNTIIAKRDVTVSWSDHTALTSAISRMVQNVAFKLWQGTRPRLVRHRTARSIPGRP